MSVEGDEPLYDQTVIYAQERFLSPRAPGRRTMMGGGSGGDGTGERLAKVEGRLEGIDIRLKSLEDLSHKTLDALIAIRSDLSELKAELGHRPTKQEVDRLLWRVGRWVIGLTLAGLIVIVRWDAITAFGSRLSD